MRRLKEEKGNLEEQVLELEEAENDARLMTQRLQVQLVTLLHQYEAMRLELTEARETIEKNYWDVLIK